MPSPSGLCIKARKKHGEGLRRVVLHHNLLDTSRKPRATTSHILIPISRVPSEEESAAIQRISSFEIKECRLASARSPPKRLEDMLDGVVPPDLLAALPKSYDLIGDIIVIEDLSESMKPHGAAVGGALLKLYKGARTCLLKSGKVQGERRVPTFQLLAGKDKTDTIYTEHGLKMKIDLAKVYFSPRLAYERQRIAGLVDEGDTVVDMFAGVGPFSLTIAKRVRATVHSIDINPDAIALLEKNICLNRLRGDIRPICGDAAVVAKTLGGIADHVIMNLPGSALDFLYEAVALLKPRGGFLHVYFFLADPDISHAASLISVSLKEVCSEMTLKGLRAVKEVAPKKWQYVADVACKVPDHHETASLPRQRRS
jgi:tRNA (guanine37-N1)-methyltransferase